MPSPGRRVRWPADPAGPAKGRGWPDRVRGTDCEDDAPAIRTTRTATDVGQATVTHESRSPPQPAATKTISAPSTDMVPIHPTPCTPRVSLPVRPQRSHSNCHDNGPVVTQSSQQTQKVIEDSAGRGFQQVRGAALRRRRHYADVGIHSGNASVRSAHSAGTAPAFPEPITPPTMAHVVSTSPPTCAVVQKARS